MCGFFIDRQLNKTGSGIYFNMIYLFLVALIWSFSFSFIEIYLSNQVDTWFSVFVRILLAFLLFSPFLRKTAVSFRHALSLMMTGALQLGIMYFFYYQAFLYISVPEILLFKTMTPLYITLFYDLSTRKRLRMTYLFTTLLAIAGAVVIRYKHISTNFIIGFILIQCADFCFALGQVRYKRIMEKVTIPQHYAFSWVYLGALLAATSGLLAFGNYHAVPTSAMQWIILVWLGVVSSGICYFLWNYGATKVDAGILAIMNNLIIPTGILINVIVTDQHLDWFRFSIGALLIVLAIVIHKLCIVERPLPAIAAE